jgi:hypothetical protein
VARRTRIIVGLALVAIGLVWIGQGLGLVRGSSFMVDDVRWAIAGLIGVVVGVAIAVSGRARSSSAP